MITLLTALVVAAGTPAAAPADPARLAAARTLVQQLQIGPQLQKMLAQNVQVMRSGVAMRALLSQQPGFVPAYQANKAKFDPILQKAGGIQADIADNVMRDNASAVVDAAVRSYAANYTLAELQGLSAFYKTPLGQSFFAKDGRVRAEINESGNKIMGAKLQTAMQANASRISAALAPLKTIAGPKPAAKK
ncbi:DUF2059 domain-containing protein [Sandarakinorhabdus sp. DWP1-3-1]|uniref:DUF2059 domain-containing protein n=1 Tax=Sandarakinorhabdus sp. DWP1-3-1 TaxID=2804627 RepID=UPI003CFB89DB